MNTSCAIEAIRKLSIAVVSVSSSPGRKKKLQQEWCSPCVVEQDLAAFRVRISMMLKVEVAQYLAQAEGRIPEWKAFDLSRSIVFPEIFKDYVYQYGGAGQIFKYDMNQVRAYLQATKSTKLVDYEKIIDKFNCASVVSVDDCDAIEILYPNGYLLNMRKAERDVRWYLKGNLERELQFRDGESPQGLLTALEDFSATGAVNEAYAMFMLTPFDLDMDHISFNQRGRLFIQELGI